jgi:UDP-galactopyranose mutase
MAYDVVIVGAGMFGASLARTLTDRGRKVLVVEKRPHVGGMCHTEIREGIVFHVYGPHVFHTNDEKIWNHVNRFAYFIPYTTRTKAVARGKLWSLPVNLMTLYQLWGVRTPRDAQAKLDSVRIPIKSPANLEEWVLSAYGEEIYETFFRGYTKKQWGRDPEQLPAAIAQRLPLRTTFEDNYFTDRYQGIPFGGYTNFFQRLLQGIEVRLGCEFQSDRQALERLGRIVYSGRIDEYFDYRYGDLSFRSCRFDTESLAGDFQGNAVVNYCDEEIPWTRIVEHKHFTNPRHERTLVTREYPFECGRRETPLYPVNDRTNAVLYERYTAIPTSTVFAGRLGSYRYFDMCEVIAQAWTLADRLA